MAANGVACETCQFYQQAAPKSGICKFNPPQPFILPGPPDPLTGGHTIKMQAMWPSVGAADWCGKHPLFGIGAPLDKRLGADAKGSA